MTEYRDVLLTVKVRAPASMSPERVAEVVNALINAGLEDAADTLENDDDSNLETTQTAQAAVDMHIQSPQVEEQK